MSSSGEGGTALVFFIGGCTYSEISALRFLSSRGDQGEAAKVNLFVCVCVCIQTVHKIISNSHTIIVFY